MSNHSFRGRRALPVVLLGLAACLIWASPAVAATVIDEGSAAGGERCSDTPAETTCLLPIGGPVASDGALSSIDVGESDAVLLIARPVAETPGTFKVVSPTRTPFTWRPQPGTTVIHSAVPVLAGDQLVLLDPLVTTSASSVDLEAPVELNEMTTGELVDVRALGRLTIEADADRDGFGDESSDLCPGVVGRRCVPGALTVALSGPAYVPSLLPLSWTWTATNAGPTPQPFVVNIFSGEATPSVTGPAGSTCMPGAASTAEDVFVPQVQRSPLTSVGTSVPGVRPHVHYPKQNQPAAGWSHCRLPVLAPGQTVSGTVGGTGGIVNNSGLAVSGLPPMIDDGSSARSTLTASGVVSHDSPVKQHASWRPTAVTPGVVSVTGKLLLTARCGGPAAAQTCSATAEVKAPIGGTVLGRTAAPVVAKPGASVSPVVIFSKKGLKWLATHLKSSVDLSVTTSWPDENPETATVRVKPVRSAALKKKLKALVKPKKKPKKKRR